MAFGLRHPFRGFTGGFQGFRQYHWAECGLFCPTRSIPMRLIVLDAIKSNVTDFVGLAATRDRHPRVQI
jgi:hypothetical protein